MIPILKGHQRDALQKLSNGKILWGGVGSGKSHVAVAYYMENEAPKHVYVITTAKKRNDRDWQHLFYEFGVGPATGFEAVGKGRGSGKNHGTVDGGADHGDGGLSTAGLHHHAGSGGQPEQGTAVGSHGSTDQQAAGSLHPVDMSGAPRSGTVGPHAASVDGNPNGVGSASMVESAGDGLQRGMLELRGEIHPRRDSRTAAGPDAVSEETPADSYYASGSRRGSELLPAAEGGGRHPGGGEPGVPGQYPWVVTVDSWNNIAKYADVQGAFFIFDEQRLVGSGNWTRKFLRIAKHNNWVMLSATPGDTWMDYIPVFVANGYYKNRTAFITEHVVYNNFSKFPKVDRYINVGKLMRLRAQLLVHMPYERHTTRRHVEVPLLYDKEALERVLKDRWHVYEERPLRDVSEMFSVARRIVNGDPSRLEMVCALWERHPKLIVFYNFNYELESLRSLKEYYGLSSAIARQKESTSFEKSSSGTQSIVTGGKTGTELSGSGVSTSMRTSTDGSKSIPGSADPWTNRGSGTSPNGSNKISISTPGTTGSGGKKLEAAPIDPSQKKGGELWTPGTLSASTSSAKLILATALEKFGLRKSRTISSIGSTKSSSDKSRPTKTLSVGPQGSGTTERTSSTTSIAEWNGHKHEPIPTTDRWLYLVQYTAGAEGWNCIETDAMITYSHNYSWKVSEQAYGRIDRLNTPFKDLWYYKFTTDSWIDRAIERSLQSKETFNEAKYVRMFMSGA